MYNTNNNNNGSTSQNIWDQMALFNQLTLCNILNGRNDLGTPELRAAVASMSEEQKDDALVFLDCNTEELAGLPDGWGMQAIANICTLLDYLPTIEPNTGGNLVRVTHKSVDGVASTLLPNLKKFGSSQRWLQVHRWIQNEVFRDDGA